MSWVTVAVGGMQAVQSVQAGRAARQQAELQAQASEWQGRLAEQEALRTASVIRRAGRRQVAEANSAFVGAGVALGQGSAADVEREITTGFEQDAFQAILEGKRRALGLSVEAAGMRAEGRMRQAAGVVGALDSLLSTGAKAYGKWQTTPSRGDGLSQGDRRKLGVY